MLLSRNEILRELNNVRRDIRQSEQLLKTIDQQRAGGIRNVTDHSYKQRHSLLLREELYLVNQFKGIMSIKN